MHLPPDEPQGSIPCGSIVARGALCTQGGSESGDVSTDPFSFCHSTSRQPRHVESLGSCFPLLHAGNFSPGSAWGIFTFLFFPAPRLQLQAELGMGYLQLLVFPCPTPATSGRTGHGVSSPSCFSLPHADNFRSGKMSHEIRPLTHSHSPCNSRQNAYDKEIT